MSEQLKNNDIEYCAACRKKGHESKGKVVATLKNNDRVLQCQRFGCRALWSDRMLDQNGEK